MNKATKIVFLFFIGISLIICLTGIYSLYVLLYILLSNRDWKRRKTVEQAAVKTGEQTAVTGRPGE